MQCGDLVHLLKFDLYLWLSSIAKNQIDDAYTILCLLYKSPNISAPRKVKRLMAAKPSLKPIARLLVVDDEQDITTIIKKGLEANKILVDEFTNSSHALEHFREHPNDYYMVVSDIRMPSPTGFELAKEIYKINPDVKILLMSSFEIHKSEFAKSFAFY